MAIGMQKKILVVDDEESVHHALQRSLRREGYSLFFAHDALEGLELMRSLTVDMVISDQVMPTMSGEEFLEIVRDRYPGTARLMLTGQGDVDMAIGAINRGVIDRFFTKPWDVADLKVALVNAFEHQDLERESRRLLATVKSQCERLRLLGQECEGSGDTDARPGLALTH